MTDLPKTLERYRLPLRSDHVKQAAALAAPALKFARRNPFILIGAALAGVAGVIAWRNRDRIAATAQPLISDAKTKGRAFVEEAREKGESLVAQARSAGEAVVAKARANKAPEPSEPTGFH